MKKLMNLPSDRCPKPAKMERQSDGAFERKKGKISTIIGILSLAEMAKRAKGPTRTSIHSAEALSYESLINADAKGGRGEKGRARRGGKKKALSKPQRKSLAS